jgi:hypothetical protein
MGRLVRPIIGCSAETSEWATGSSGAVSYTGLLGTSGFVPEALIGTSNFGMTRKAHYTRGGISQIAAVWPGYYVAASTTGNLGQELTSGNYSASSWVEYPAGTYTQMDNATPVVGGTNTVGTSLNISIPAGAKFWIWSYMYGGTFPYYNNNIQINSCMFSDEYCNLNTSGVASTPGTLTDNQSHRTYAGPIALIGPRTGDCVAIVGDSRAVGSRDVVDSSYDVGNVARSIGPTYDYVNLGCSGDRAASFVFNHTLRGALVNSYATIVIDQYGQNDVHQLGSTVAQLNAYKARIQAMFRNKRYVGVTIEPTTTSSDSWASLAAQTLDTAPFNANRLNFNDALRLSGTPYLELASTVESSLDSGKWIVNGVANYATPDGIHATQAGSLLQSASSATFLAAIAAAPASGGPQPNCNLTFVGTSSFDTSAQKFGTGSLNISSGHYAYCYGIQPATTNETVECWIKTTVSGCFAFSSWFGQVYVNSGVATFKDCGGTARASSITVTDGLWHHFALVTTPTGQTLYVDGVSAATSPQAQQNSTPAYTSFGIGFNGNVAAPGAQATCEIDEVAIWNTAQYTTGFTPPTSPYLGTEAGLIAVWHMDSNGNGVLGPVLSSL